MTTNSKQAPGSGGHGKKSRRSRGRRPRRGAAAGKSTIHEYATCDSCDALLRCIHAGADVNAADASGLSPLMHAVLSAKVNNVLALLEYGAAANEVAVLTEDIIVHHAAKRYTMDFSRLFSEHRFPPEYVRIPVTPLHLACMRGDLALIAVLLVNGANPRVVVRGPLPELYGAPADFYARFVGGLFPRDFLVNRESTADFLADCAEALDESAFRVYLHKTGVVNASSRSTCLAQVRRCAELLKRDLLGSPECDARGLHDEIIRICPDFPKMQKGGLSRSLNRFVEYAKSPMRKKYNGLEAINLV